jgi:hypothetical protein
MEKELTAAAIRLQRQRCNSLARDRKQQASTSSGKEDQKIYI